MYQVWYLRVQGIGRGATATLRSAASGRGAAASATLASMRWAVVAVLVIGLLGTVLIELDVPGAWLLATLLLVGVSVTAHRASRARRG
jgi:hypothetical protein